MSVHSSTPAPQARDERYPESDLLEALQLTVEEADKCQMVAQQLCSSQGKVTLQNRAPSG